MLVQEKGVLRPLRKFKTLWEKKKGEKKSTNRKKGKTGGYPRPEKKGGCRKQEEGKTDGGPIPRPQREREWAICCFSNGTERPAKKKEGWVRGEGIKKALHKTTSPVFLFMGDRKKKLGEKTLGGPQVCNHPVAKKKAKIFLSLEREKTPGNSPEKGEGATPPPAFWCWPEGNRPTPTAPVGQEKVERKKKAHNKKGEGGGREYEMIKIPRRGRGPPLLGRHQVWRGVDEVEKK